MVRCPSIHLSHLSTAAAACSRFAAGCPTGTHTHSFNGPLSGTTRVSQYQKGKPMWILLKQETVSGSGISWAICKSEPRSRQITTPASHHSFFLQAGCPSCHPTNSVKALKANAGCPTGKRYQSTVAGGRRPVAMVHSSMVVNRKYQQWMSTAAVEGWTRTCYCC